MIFISEKNVNDSINDLVMLPPIRFVQRYC